MNISIGIIIQARTGSSRLPNKMILPFYENKGILELLICRLKEKFKDIPIIVATTNKSNDDIIEDICSSLSVICFRGDESNVLARFIAAANVNNIDKIIRICADNVFLDLEALEILIKKFKTIECDYLAYVTKDHIPTIKTHYGFWAEAVRLNTLKIVSELTDNYLYYEHVTNYIYSNPSLFKTKYIEIPESVDSRRDIRLTIDTSTDFKIQSEIYGLLMKDSKRITIDNILNTLKLNPHYFQKMKKQIKNNIK